MSPTQIYKTPGVYVAELAAFPPSVVGVATAIPVFVGYTAAAAIAGKPVLFKPILIRSLAAFEEVFGGGYKAVYNLATPPPPPAGRRVSNDASEASDAFDDPDDYDFRVWDPASPPEYRYYELTARAGASGSPPTAPAGMLSSGAMDAAPAQPRFNLYNSMRLFYANGGADCYVVSVGTYENSSAVALQPLLDGLKAAAEQVGPTMIVVPDAVLLPGDDKEPWRSADFAIVAKAMLRQASTLQDRVAVLDVYGSQYVNSSDHPDVTLEAVVERFHEDVGDEGLSYGMAYFPFLDTTVIPLSDVDYTYIDNSPVDDDDEGTVGALQQILGWENQNRYGGTPRYAVVQNDIDAISYLPDDPAAVPAYVKKLNQNLIAALPLLKSIELQVVAMNDVLPPSAAMAGVYTRVDAASGVWNAPANVTLASVLKPTVQLNNKDQENLNMPVNGKAIDALRAFPGRGTVVWGARTLDGNSPDYRYVQVRRTLIYIERSIKAALDPFVFAPNTGQTWATVVSMVSGFLTGLWSRGGLMGAAPADAFTVQCGVGSTMTGTDVLNGYMIVQVTLALIRPAEFIEITFKQTMEGVG